MSNVIRTAAAAARPGRTPATGFAGARTDHHLDVAGLSQRVWTTGTAPDGEDLWVSVHPDHVRVIIDEPHGARAA